MTREIGVPFKCAGCGGSVGLWVPDTELEKLRAALAQPVETKGMVEARKILDFYLVDATHDGPFEDPSPEGTVPVAVHELRLLREALRA